MGFGGKASTPDVPAVTPAPKQEVQKPVTEAATAARQHQKDKAARASGLTGSIHTSPLLRAGNNAQGNSRKTLLGQ
ncbi:MAG: hypothetical protein IJA79_05990 [Desulfovibrio sp.]|nr:hypothetical protein [Desulfovibrio sp.]